MEELINRAIRRYLKKHYPDEMNRIIYRANKIRPKLMHRAPDLGGKENTLANNLDMFILFLSYYEATDHRMGGDPLGTDGDYEVYELIDRSISYGNHKTVFYAHSRRLCYSFATLNVPDMYSTSPL